MNPVTIPEWTAYIDTLEGDQLRSKAKAANSIDFLRSLEKEGINPKTAVEILGLFARRFQVTNQQPPSKYAGALVDFAQMLTPITLPEESAISTVAPIDVADRWSDSE